MTDQNDLEQLVLEIKTWVQREAELLKGKRPCPFCGSVRLSVTGLWDGDGEYPAIECDECKGAAPADQP